MTANELADEIDVHVSMGGSKFFKEVSTMLRTIPTLEKEIGELKNAKDYWCLAYKDVFNKLEFQTLSKNERPFICGLSGDKGSDNMNEYILVCPADGADGFAVYKKHKDYSAPGY